MHKYAIEYLKEIINLLEKKDYKSLKEVIDHSPSGDDMGCDNYYLSFECLGLDDFGSLINKLDDNE